MNGRLLSHGSSSSEKNLLFHNIRYVKPAQLLNEIHHQDIRNLYYDNNPYYLNQNLLNNNRNKGIYNTSSRNNNTSRDLSETSSQRSSKVIRANGLRLAEKPKIYKGPERQPSLSQSRNNEQNRKFFEKTL